MNPPGTITIQGGDLTTNAWARIDGTGDQVQITSPGLDDRVAFQPGAVIMAGAGSLRISMTPNGEFRIEILPGGWARSENACIQSLGSGTTLVMTGQATYSAGSPDEVTATVTPNQNGAPVVVVG